MLDVRVHRVPGFAGSDELRLALRPPPAVVEALELGVVKSIAGFLNSRRGGTLIIGVVDDMERRGEDKVCGLDHDFRLSGNRGVDGFENTLMTTIGRALGKVAATRLEVRFESLGVAPAQVCRIDVLPAASPIFVKWKDNQLFFVRVGNSTRQFSIAEAVDYIQHRFG